MPIVSNIVESSTAPNGSANVTLRMYDQDGTEYTQTFFIPPNFNLQAKVDNTIIGLNEQLAQSEFESLIGL